MGPDEDLRPGERQQDQRRPFPVAPRYLDQSTMKPPGTSQPTMEPDEDLRPGDQRRPFPVLEHYIVPAAAAAWPMNHELRDFTLRMVPVSHSEATCGTAGRAKSTVTPSKRRSEAQTAAVAASSNKMHGSRPRCRGRWYSKYNEWL
eukprot:g67952.t1